MTAAPRRRRPPPAPGRQSGPAGGKGGGHNQGPVLVFLATSPAYGRVGFRPISGESLLRIRLQRVKLAGTQLAQNPLTLTNSSIFGRLSELTGGLTTTEEDRNPDKDFGPEYAKGPLNFVPA